MGREMRRVPAGWEHPRGSDGALRPLYDEDYQTAAREWKSGFKAWEAGERPEYCKDFDGEFWEWDGGPPDHDLHRPVWPEESRTHVQMYETCSEGTPISPVMADAESLARWLADNSASSFGGMTATYEQWLSCCETGAPSAIIENGRLMSGVEGMASETRSKA